MTNERLTQDECETLFPENDASDDGTQRDYRAFQRIIEQMDRTPVPELSAPEKADIFRQAWHRSLVRKTGWFRLDLFRKPAVTFALGLALGCVVMFVCLRPRVCQGTSTEPALTVEVLGATQTYTGRTMQGLYPDIENPKLVIEKTNRDAAPRRVLYGTLDDGDVYVVWNL